MSFINIRSIDELIKIAYLKPEAIKDCCERIVSIIDAEKDTTDAGILEGLTGGLKILIDNFTYYDIFNPNKQERTTLSEAKRRCNSLVWIGIIEGYLLNTMNRLDIMLKIRKVYHLIDFGKLIDIVVKENDYENRILLFNKS